MSEITPNLQVVKPQEPQNQGRYSSLFNIRRHNGPPITDAADEIMKANQHNQDMRNKLKIVNGQETEKNPRKLPRIKLENPLKRQKREKSITNILEWKQKRHLAETAHSTQLQLEQTRQELANVTLEAEKKQNHTEKKLDIAVEMAAEGEVARRTDEKTGLGNELAYNEDLQEAINSGESFHVAFGDIDNFKAWNEVYGHTTGGDPALQALRNLPAKIYRKHGDELMIIYIGKSREEIAANLTECNSKLAEIGHLLFDKAKKNTDTTYVVPDKLSTSWGVTEGKPDDTIHTVSTRADSALGKAKVEGEKATTKGLFYIIDSGGNNPNQLNPKIELDTAA